MKRTFVALLIIAVLLGLVCGWMVLGPVTSFPEKTKYLYVYDSAPPQQQVQQQFGTQQFIRNQWLFNLLANRLDVWARLKPGRFELRKGMNMVNLVRMLRNNSQSPVRLVINKLRTNEDLAHLLGKNFVNDSAQTLQWLRNPDSLSVLGVDTNTLMTLVIPDTYIMKWNTPVKRILLRLQSEQINFWNKNNRQQKAKALGLDTKQVYTLASIVEEETNKQDEKGNIASVYLNRLHKGMALGADPTIKFALKDFSLKRILRGHLEVVSAYNTYRNKGLPPGPICTPSANTIDAVLDEPKTDYLFFVAKSDFSGYHHFSSNYAEHEQYAKLYQQALDAWMLKNSK